MYKDEGYKFMGAAFEVYNVQGHGLAEEIYQESLELELEMRAIGFRGKQELACFYKGRELKSDTFLICSFADASLWNSSP